MSRLCLRPLSLVRSSFPLSLSFFARLRDYPERECQQSTIRAKYYTFFEKHQSSMKLLFVLKHTVCNENVLYIGQSPLTTSLVIVELNNKNHLLQQVVSLKPHKHPGSVNERCEIVQQMKSIIDNINRRVVNLWIMVF